MNWTEEQLAEYQAKREGRATIIPVDLSEADLGPESNLQDKIEKWCEDNGFPYFHDRSRKCNTPGFPDLVIALKWGRTLWLELKSKSGRLDLEQKRWRLQLLALGHEWHEVRSYRKFMEVIHAGK